MLHQVGDLFELNVRLRCQKVKLNELKITLVIYFNKILQALMKTVKFYIKDTLRNCAENQGGNRITGIQNSGARGKWGSYRRVICSV